MMSADFLTTLEFNEFLQEAMAFAYAYLLENKVDSFVPTCNLLLFDAIHGKKVVTAILPDFQTSDRYQYLRTFGEKVARDKHLCLAFIFLSEVWRSTYDQNTLPENAPMPRDDPHRIESVVAMAQAVDARLAVGIIDVRRDAKNILIPTIPDFMLYDEADPPNATSDLCNAFWQGYQIGIRKSWFEPKKAPGEHPEAQNANLN